MVRIEKPSSTADSINDLVLRQTTIGTAPLPAVAKGGLLVEVELDKIEPNPDQPRQWIDPEKIAELAASIVSRGTRQPDNPILVRPNVDGRRFILVSGERRWRAKQLLREQAPATEKALWNTIKALLHDDIDDEASAFIALEENLQREDLSPVEEGAAYVRLMERYSAKSIKELAARIGKPEKRVQQMIRLHRAPPFLRDAIVKGKLVVDGGTSAEGRNPRQTRRRLEFRTAVEFLKLFDHLTAQDPRTRENPKAREKIEERVGGWVERALAEGWTVRRVENQCAAIKTGRQRKEPSVTNEELPTYEVTADRFVVYLARASASTEDDRRELLARVASALGLAMSSAKDHVVAGAF